MAVIVLCFCVFALIVDSQSALMGAREGLELCIKTVIPSLMPFFFLSVLLTNRLSGKKISMLRPLGRILRLPEGAESIFLIGILGGYPVGAQAISQAAQAGSLDRSNAKRMLGFCSNAGPSFIFGILGRMFSSPSSAWALWIIHILSAILVGVSLPGKVTAPVMTVQVTKLSVPSALERAMKIMVNVCGWVILFRVLIRFLNRWILWLFPGIFQNVIIGVLELTNGCCALCDIDHEGLRFVLASCFLSLGGFCVAMQTMAVTEKIGTGMYFPGKILQTAVSVLLAWGYQALFLSYNHRMFISPIMIIPVLILLLTAGFYLKNRKNNSSIPQLSGV